MSLANFKICQISRLNYLILVRLGNCKRLIHLITKILNPNLLEQKFNMYTKKIERKNKLNKMLANGHQKHLRKTYCVAKSLDSTFNFKNGRDSRKWQLSKWIETDFLRKKLFTHFSLRFNNSQKSYLLSTCLKNNLVLVQLVICWQITQMLRFAI